MNRVLHYKPEKDTAIINACIVLQHMYIEHNIPEVVDEIIKDIDMGMEWIVVIEI